MGDDEYLPPPRSPVVPAVLTSLVTTAILFFALRALDGRGLLPGAARSGGEAPKVEGPAPGPAAPSSPLAAPSAADVPSLLGLRPEQARELLQGRGLLLAFSTEREDPQHPAGTIAEQTPLPGSQLPKGSAVQAVLSRGAPEQKPIPKLTGMRLRAAKELLEQQGFKAGKIRYDSDGDRPTGVVLEQKPAAATPALAGTPVDLTINED